MISTIEQAILNRLQSASDTGLLGYKLHVDTYGDQLETEDGLKQWAHRMPLALVVLVEDVPVGKYAQFAWKQELTFGIVIAASNRRNDAAARTGSNGKVGTYQILQDVRTLLVNQTLGLSTVDSIQPYRTRALPPGRKGSLPISLLLAEFRVTYAVQGAHDALPASLPEGLDATGGLLSVLEQAAGIDKLQTLHVDWQPPKLAEDTLNLYEEPQP